MHSANYSNRSQADVSSPSQHMLLVSTNHRLYSHSQSFREKSYLLGIKVVYTRGRVTQTENSTNSRIVIDMVRDVCPDILCALCAHSQNAVNVPNRIKEEKEEKKTKNSLRVYEKPVPAEECSSARIKWYSELCSTEWCIQSVLCINTSLSSIRCVYFVLLFANFLTFIYFYFFCLRRDSGLHLFAMLNICIIVTWCIDATPAGTKSTRIRIHISMYFELMRKATFIASSFAFNLKSCKFVNKHKKLEQTIILRACNKKTTATRTTMYAK